MSRFIGLNIFIQINDHKHINIKSRVRNLYHMLKTLVGQCRIYLRAKSKLKIYDLFQLLLDRMIESLFLFFQGMLNRLV